MHQVKMVQVSLTMFELEYRFESKNDIRVCCLSKTNKL